MCREYAARWSDALPPPATEAKTLAGTVAGDLADATAQRDAINKARLELDSLLSREKELSATLQAGKAEFSKRMKAGKAEYDKFQAQSRPAGAPVDFLKTAHDEYSAAVAAGETQVQQSATLAALESHFAAAINPLSGAADERLPLLDANETVSLLESIAKDAEQAAKTAKTPAAIEAAAKVKASRDEAKASQKQLADVFAAGVRDARTALGKAGSPSQRSSQSEKRLKDSLKLGNDLATAKRALAEVDGALQTAAQGGKSAPGVGGAKSTCDIQRVDFRNFSFAHGAKSFRKGKSTDPNYPDSTISQIAYVDLDGSGSKQAVVAIDGPGMGPRGTSCGSLYVFGYDSWCSLHELDTTSGCVDPGTAKAKSYVYSETLYVTPQGMAGDFPSGRVDVEVKLVHGKLKEIRRSAPHE